MDSWDFWRLSFTSPRSIIDNFQNHAQDQLFLCVSLPSTVCFTAFIGIHEGETLYIFPVSRCIWTLWPSWWREGARMATVGYKNSSEPIYSVRLSLPTNYLRESSSQIAILQRKTAPRFKSSRPHSKER